MSRVVLQYGIVGDHDGAYDYVRDADVSKPEYGLGHHGAESVWPEDTYTVVEVFEDERAIVRRAVEITGLTAELAGHADGCIEITEEDYRTDELDEPAKIALRKFAELAAAPDATESASQAASPGGQNG